MSVYEAQPKEVALTLTPAEIKALREALGALEYNIPGASSADGKLREALKAVAQ